MSCKVGSDQADSDPPKSLSEASVAGKCRKQYWAPAQGPRPTKGLTLCPLPTLAPMNSMPDRPRTYLEASKERPGPAIGPA